MRIPTWRLLLTGGAVVILAAVGVGLAAASSSPAAAPAAGIVAAPSADPGAASSSPALRQGLVGRLGRILANRPFARHLVHATVTVTDKDGNLITFQLDHGTIASIGSGTLAISEAGGATITVSTDSNTVVFLGDGAGRGSLSDLKVGDQLFVQSRLDGGTALAKHILRVPTEPAS
jgi:Domain of unknown function (DUF5666)